MKKIILIFIFFNFFLSASAEEVPAGYVAKWETVLLNEKDFIDNNSERCTSFSGVLSKGKIEQPQIIALKIVNGTLKNFIRGYQSIENIQFDTVVVWPNYEQSDWYVLMGDNNCFVRSIWNKR